MTVEIPFEFLERVVHIAGELAMKDAGKDIDLLARELLDMASAVIETRQ